ncbi:SMC-Scp complex subunit ScpB [Natribacillus halophilus]|uniref:Segregation and condensation protein B n=1 Tax=Natribacillus halophilus TaxID=549003 RepID=A0A1G8JHH2_9BACI|nr:SMC-Scp complex subunit ScpB [Natribacillus halophilus]SDI30080.1 condensin subunit ScpB [Natribacillus halophilus]
MNEDIGRILETLLYVSGDEGLEAARAAEVLGIDRHRIIAELQALASRFEDEGRALTILQFDTRFQMATRDEFSTYVERYAHPPQQKTLSQAALETLAIVAYQQPVTRTTVEEIRGVNADHAMSTLVGKGLVAESGRVKGAGRAILYKTTARFLDVFNLRSLDDLPSLEEEEPAEQLDLFLSGYDKEN